MKPASAFLAFSLAIFAALAAPRLCAQSSLVWSGTNDDGVTINPNWSTGGPDTNWLDSGAASPFTGNADVLFDDTSSVRAVNISESLNPGSMTVSTTGAYTFTGTGVITSAGALTLDSSNTGLLILANTGANFFADGIAIVSGTLQGDATTLASGSIAIGDATLVFDQTGAATYSSIINATLSTGTLVKQNTGTLTLDNTVNVAALDIAQGALILDNAAAANSANAINIAANATLGVTGLPAFALDAPLTGSGTFDINLLDPSASVTFGSNLGAAFAGNLVLRNSTFTLDSGALANATLTSAAGNTTTIATGVHSTGNLVLDGGLLEFNLGAPAPGPGPWPADADGKIETNNLTLATGTVQVAFALGYPAPAGAFSSGDLFEASQSMIVTRLINATGAITGNAAGITLIDAGTGDAVSPATSQAIFQANPTNPVATGTYGYKLSTNATDSDLANRGLNISYGLVSLTIHDDQTLDLTPVAGGNLTTFDAIISGGAAAALSINAGVTTSANPDSTVRLAAQNDFAGAITIHTGTLVAAANNALGIIDAQDPAAKLLTLENAATYDLNGHSQTLSSATTAADTAILFNAGTLAITISATLDGALIGGGALKLGESGSPASFTINSANPDFYATTTIDDAATATMNDTQALGAASVVVGDGARLTYTTAGEIASNISGSGTLNLAGTAEEITLTGVNTIASINLLAGSKVTAAANNSLGAATTNLSIASNATLTLAAPAITLGNLTMNGASTLAFAAPVSGTHSLAAATATSITAPAGSTPTLILNTNIGNGASDTLTVTGSITGTYNVILRNTGTTRAAADTTTLRLIVADPSHDIDATYTGHGTLTSGVYSYDYDFGPSGTTTNWGLDLTIVNNNDLSAPGKAILSAAASLPLAWFTEIDTLLARRFRELHDGTFTGVNGASLWMRGYTDRFNVNAKDTLVAFDETQNGMNVGLDYGKPNAKYMACAGIFAGYGDATRKTEGRTSEGSSTTASFGAYLTYINDSGFYANLVGKYSNIKSKISVNATDSVMNASFANKATGFSAEAGLCHSLADSWQLTPGVQLAFAGISSVKYATDTGVQVTQKTITTGQARAGALLAHKRTLRNGQVMLPYAKLYAATRWVSGGDVVVDDDPAGYDPHIRGARVDAGVGMTWAVSKAVQVYFDYEVSFAKDYKKPYGLAAGINFSW